MCRREGMVLLEMLVALAAAALVSLAGMRLVFLLMEEIERQAAVESERVALRQLESGLRRAFEQRCAHRFIEGSWLELKGSRKGGFLELQSMSLRTFGPDGLPGQFRLEASAGGWEQTMEPYPATHGAGRPVRIAYNGRIQVGGASRLEWKGGECPAVLEFRFPEALVADAREGFAMRRL